MKGRRPPRRIPEVLDPEEQARMLGELERSDSLSACVTWPSSGYCLMQDSAPGRPGS